MSRSHKITCIAVASAATLLFVGTITVLWFDYPELPAANRNSIAMTSAFIWAIGPAIWFALEWRKWKHEPGLAVGQQYARDFWIGAGAIVLLVAAMQLDHSKSNRYLESGCPYNGPIKQETTNVKAGTWLSCTTGTAKGCGFSCSPSCDRAYYDLKHGESVRLSKAARITFGCQGTCPMSCRLDINEP